jgi:hypothetical protein
VRPGLRPSVAVAFRGAGIARMFAGSGMAPLTNVPNGDRRDGPPELVVRGKYPVVAMPVLPRRRLAGPAGTSAGRHTLHGQQPARGRRRSRRRAGARGG